MINWGAISQATGWLPGASAWALTGGIGAVMSWEGFATDRCQIGTSSLTQACGELLGYSFTSGVEFGAAGAAIGGLVGFGVNAAVSALNGGDAG